MTIVVGAVLAWFILSRCSNRTIPTPAERVEVLLDTIIERDIDPVSVTHSSSLAEGDSLYTFRDTVDGRWSAEVTGYNVNLRSFMMLDKQERHYTTKYQPPKWEVELKAAVNPYTQWVGVGVSRSFGRVKISLDGGYDCWSKTPYVGAEASVSIWRE